MKVLKAVEFLLIALILITLTSCGSSGGGMGGSGIQKPIVSKGTITGFGSVIVNGIEFETTGATITTDDNPNAAQGDLGLGMVVTVQGTVNVDGTTGTADSIKFKDNLEGLVASVDSLSKTLVVLGQTVVWSSSTICEDRTKKIVDCASLVKGNFVEVSGFAGPNGVIQATRIEVKELKAEVELKGTIKGLNNTNKTFSIGSQVVDYSAAVLEGVPNNTLADSMFVEVKGTLDGTGILHTTKIELEDEKLQVAENEEVEIEGLVNDFTSCNGPNCIFAVNGQSIQTSSATEFKNGTSSNITVGVRLEAEGTIGANGVMIAKKVSFHETRIEMEAKVQAVDTANNTVKVLGITVAVTTLIGLEDNSSAKLVTFSLKDIQVGDFIRIRGHLDKGNIIADRIERRDPENKVLVQGPVNSVSNPNLVIIGVTVQTDSKTQFEDINEGPITQAQFFAQVQAGTLVKAKGIFNGTAIIADEVGIE